MNYNPRTEKAYKLLHEGSLALGRAEMAGMCVDVEYVQRKIQHLTRKIQRMEDNFKNSDFFNDWQRSVKTKVNINSHTQLANYLYKVKNIEPAKLTKTGKGATDLEAIQNLNISELNDLLEKNKVKKIIDVLQGFLTEQVNGVLHTNFNLHLVVSHRSSSSEPNLQNIPVRDEEAMKICRGALFPRKGHQLLEVDFKSIEVGVNACYNKDSNLIKYSSDPATDMHRDMAAQIFMVDDFDENIPEHKLLRQAAKNGFVFPEFYGDYYKNCAENLLVNWGKLPQRRWKPDEGVSMPSGTLSDHLIDKGIKSYEAFVKHLKKIEDDFWGNRFSEYADWKEMWWSTYKKHGYFDLYTGFRCSGVMDMKQVCNYPGQGTAFHCLLYSLNRIDEIMRKENWDTRLISQVHDSGIYDVLPSELNHIVETIKDVTTNKLPEYWKWIIVPLSVEFEKCEVDEPWSMKKKFEL